MIIECTPAMADALCVIFQRENVEFSTGLGPGCIAIEIDKTHEPQVRRALNQWKRALDSIINQVNQI